MIKKPLPQPMKHCALCPDPPKTIRNVLIPFITALRNFDVVQKFVMPFLLGYQTIEGGMGSPTLAIFRLAATCKKAKKIIEHFI